MDRLIEELRPRGLPMLAGAVLAGAAWPLLRGPLGEFVALGVVAVAGLAFYLPARLAARGAGEVAIGADREDAMWAATFGGLLAGVALHSVASLSAG